MVNFPKFYPTRTIFKNRPYPWNPLCGNNPMKYPMTLRAEIAQFPYSYYWRYCFMYKYFWLGSFLTACLFRKIQKMHYNERWITYAKTTRAEWYTPKREPEYDLY